MNMTEAQKKSLQTLVEGGKRVSTVAYNPNTVVGAPEADAIAAGWAQFQREATANLIEVVYTK